LTMPTTPSLHHSITPLRHLHSPPDSRTKTTPNFQSFSLTFTCFHLWIN
jgi:hypothetical protein